jgi:hypothetical protein
VGGASKCRPFQKKMTVDELFWGVVRYFKVSHLLKSATFSAGQGSFGKVKYAISKI